MTDIQQKLLELLTEVDTICKREKIAYYLCAETALSASIHEGFFPDCCQISIAMSPDHALAFIKAVKKEKRTDRMTDSMYSNKHYPDFTVRYGDRHTLMMSLPYNKVGMAPCIGVTIHMIRYKPKRFGAIYRYTKAFWKACARPIGTTAGFKRQAAVAVCHAIKNIGGKCLSRMLFKLWCSLYKTNKTAKKLSICAGAFDFSTKLVKKQSTVTFEGQAFPTFSDPENYLKTAYGPRFMNAKPKFTKPSPTSVFSTTVPYETYIERLRQQMDLKAVQKQKQQYDMLQAKVSVYNKKISKYYAIVDRTDKRFAMYEMYMPMKEQLLQLDKEERYEELNELLHPYRSALWSCYRKKLGLCFDKEIFEITMKLLEREEKANYVKKLRAMVPEEHWKPMVITDYKGDPVS